MAAREAMFIGGIQIYKAVEVDTQTASRCQHAHCEHSVTCAAARVTAATG
jgi:hypothetical protein